MTYTDILGVISPKDKVKVNYYMQHVDQYTMSSVQEFRKVTEHGGMLYNCCPSSWCLRSVQKRERGPYRGFTLLENFCA